MHHVASHTYEFVEFLDKVLKVDFSQLHLPEKRRFTYHYTCHLRGIGVKDEGVRLPGSRRYALADKAAKEGVEIPANILASLKA